MSFIIQAYFLEAQETFVKIDNVHIPKVYKMRALYVVG